MFLHEDASHNSLFRSTNHRNRVLALWVHSHHSLHIGVRTQFLRNLAVAKIQGSTGILAGSLLRTSSPGFVEIFWWFWCHWNPTVLCVHKNTHSGIFRSMWVGFWELFRRKSNTCFGWILFGKPTLRLRKTRGRIPNCFCQHTRNNGISMTSESSKYLPASLMTSCPKWNFQNVFFLKFRKIDFCEKNDLAATQCE